MTVSRRSDNALCLIFLQEEEEKLREEQSVEMVTLKNAELIESGGGGDGGVPGVQIKKF